MVEHEPVSSYVYKAKNAKDSNCVSFKCTYIRKNKKQAVMSAFYFIKIKVINIL